MDIILFYFYNKECSQLQKFNSKAKIHKFLLDCIALSPCGEVESGTRQLMGQDRLTCRLIAEHRCLPLIGRQIADRGWPLAANDVLRWPVISPSDLIGCGIPSDNDSGSRLAGSHKSERASGKGIHGPFFVRPIDFPFETASVLSRRQTSARAARPIDRHSIANRRTRVDPLVTMIETPVIHLQANLIDPS